MHLQVYAEFWILHTLGGGDDSEEEVEFHLFLLRLEHVLQLSDACIAWSHSNLQGTIRRFQLPLHVS